MKKALKAILIILAVLVLLLLLLAGGALWYVNHYVQTPEFKHEVLGLASRATGTKVGMDDLSVSLFSGVELHGVTVGNPAGFPGDLLTAKLFALRYRLWPLLHEQVEVETLVLDTPVINLIRNDQGEWNYNRISGRTATASAKTKSSRAAPAPESEIPSQSLSANIGGVEVSLSNVEMQHATVVMATASGQELFKVQEASFHSTVDLTGDQLTGNGTAMIELINASNALFLRHVGTPVAVTLNELKLGPLTGTVADGAITGDASLSLAADSSYSLHLQVKDADVVKLIKETGITQQLFSSGKLQITTALTGTGGVDTIVGAGKVEITGGQLADMPIVNLAAAALQISALQNLKFTECLIQYTISNNIVETPVISLKSPQVQLTGQGRLTLANNKLDHTFTLTLAGVVLDSTAPAIREAFTHHDDGSYSIDFKVWGPVKSPKTDLQKKLLKVVGGQLLQQFLK